MTSRRVVAALLAVTVSATAARAADTAEPTLRVRESMAQRLVVAGPPGDQVESVVRSRALRAVYRLPADPTLTVALTGSSAVSLRLGGLSFDATLGDDPRFGPLRRSVAFAFPAEPGAPSPPSSESRVRLKIRWSGDRVSVRVSGPAAALLRDVELPLGPSKISMPAESTITVGDGTWLFLGTVTGAADVRRKTYSGGSFEFTSARVAFVGQNTDPSLDRVPPKVHVVAPVADDHFVISPVKAEGVVSDDRGVAGIFWSLDGGPETETPFHVESAGDGDESGSFAFGVPVTVTGVRRLRVRVEDAAGNSATDEVRFEFRVLRSKFLATGGDTSFIVRDDAVLAWGADASGQLGDGPGASRTSPSAVAQLRQSVAISSSDTHTVTLRADGTVWCCGVNSAGQLGDGTTSPSEVPVRVEGLSGAIAVAAGWTHSVALLDDGTVWCWGDNADGACGDGTLGGERLVPFRVPGIPASVAVTAGLGTTFALGEDGVVRSWGLGIYGALGNDTQSSGTPREVGATMFGGPFRDVVEMAAGATHALARKADGSVWAWGYAGYGNLGIGTKFGANIALVPVQTQGISTATAIAASSYSSAALLEDGTVVAWGDGGWGTLGDGTRSTRFSPIFVSGLTNVVKLASGASSRHLLALDKDDVVTGWGSYTTGTPLPLWTTGEVWHLLPEVIDLP